MIAALKAARVEAVAVSLLFSFLNPAHERRLGARLRAALPDVPVYLSSEVLPEIREFERTSTTAVCAYVGPILASYLERLESATRAQGLPPLYVMGSNGGVLEAAEAVAMPAMAVESGPAAGVVAAALVARQTGRPNLLSFDMGGTTAKASLIRDGQYETTPEYEVGGGASGNRWMHGTGHPIRVPVIDLAEVSAGGGSIAWVDRAGALRVGPQERRRRSRARLLRPRRHRADRHRLQPGARLSRQGLAAGGRPADRPRRGRSRRRASGSPSRWASTCARRRPPSSTSSTTPWRRRSRSSPSSAATIRASSCWRPSAAPARCMPPRWPTSSASPRCSARPSRARSRRSASSARDLKRDYVRTVYTTTATADPAALGGRLRRAGSARAAAMLDRAGVAPERRRFERSVDARYERQSYELAVPVPARALDAAALHADRRGLPRPPPATYGHDNRGEPVQLVSVRLTAIGAIPPLLVRDKTARAGTRRGQGASASVWFRDTGEVDATVYDRARMPAGLEVPGPAVIESLESTILVPPGWQATHERGRLRAADSRTRNDAGRMATMKDAPLKADPAAFEIVKNSLYKIAEEMRVVLAKTAYSPILKSAGDYSCGVFDARGEMVAQGPDLPIHLGSHARRRARRRRRLRRGRARRRRVHPQRSLLRRQPSARRQRGAPRLPRGPAARLRLPARALARCRLGHARQLRRGHGDLRRGPAPAAAAARQPRRRSTSTSRR